MLLIVSGEIFISVGETGSKVYKLLSRLFKKFAKSSPQALVHMVELLFYHHYVNKYDKTNDNILLVNLRFFSILFIKQKKYIFCNIFIESCLEKCDFNYKFPTGVGHSLKVN